MPPQLVHTGISFEKYITADVPQKGISQIKSLCKRWLYSCKQCNQKGEIGTTTTTKTKGSTILQQIKSYSFSFIPPGLLLPSLCQVYEQRPQSCYIDVVDGSVQLGWSVLQQFCSCGVCPCVMVSVRPAGKMSVCGRNFAIVLIELYPFIPLSVTLIVFQGHSSVKQFKIIILCSYPIKLKQLCMIITTWGLHWHCRFAGLTFSRLQVYQKYKLQILCFGFLSSIV